MNFIEKIFKPYPADDEVFLAAIKKITGLKPNASHYYIKAFTHSSIKELTSDGKPVNYERLEFLGDALLSSVIAIYLFRVIPNGTEGYLTQMRSKIVSREHLNEIG